MTTLTRENCQLAIQNHISHNACSPVEFREVWDTTFRSATVVNNSRWTREQLAKNLAVVIANNVGSGVDGILRQTGLEQAFAFEERTRIAESIVTRVLEGI